MAIGYGAEAGEASEYEVKYLLDVLESAGYTGDVSELPNVRIAVKAETNSGSEIGKDAIAIGNMAKARGKNGIAIGSGVEVTGANGIAIGSDVVARHNQIRIGANDITDVMIGSYNLGNLFKTNHPHSRMAPLVLSADGISANAASISANTASISANTASIAANAADIAAVDGASACWTSVWCCWTSASVCSMRT